MCEVVGFCAGIDLLKALCQERVHLGTSDPAHMVSSCRTNTDQTNCIREGSVSSGKPKLVCSVCSVVKVQLRLQVSASGTRGDRPAQTQVATGHLSNIHPYTDE